MLLEDYSSRVQQKNVQQKDAQKNGLSWIRHIVSLPCPASLQLTQGFRHANNNQTIY